MRAKYGVNPGDSFTQEAFDRRWNYIVDDFSRLLPTLVTSPGQGDLSFPWKTDASLFDDGKGTPRLWRMDVALGTVNDLAPPIIYRATADPRGWTPATPPTDGSPIVERSLAEFDTPFLLLTSPAPNAPASSTDQFKQVSDYARPDFFRTADMWELLLYQSSVFLTTTVTDLSGPNLPISFLSRLATAVRLSAGPLPSVALGSEAGVLELARVFLLRDPTDTDGSNDTIMVRQQVYYCLQAELDSPSPNYLVTADGPVGGVSNVDPSLIEFDFWTA
jgi:hypothetical protein